MRWSLLILLFSIAALSSCSNDNTASVTVINKSGQTIDSLKIELNGDIKSINHLKNDQKTKLTFCCFSDSSYILDGTYHDTTPINGEFGYVTHGMDFEVTFIIKEHGNVKYSSIPK